MNTIYEVPRFIQSLIYKNYDIIKNPGIQQIYIYTYMDI
jgi:hypothetical protein